MRTNTTAAVVVAADTRGVGVVFQLWSENTLLFRREFESGCSETLPAIGPRTTLSDLYKMMP